MRRDAAGQDATIVDGAALQHRPITGRAPAWVDEPWVFYAEQDRLSSVPSVGGKSEVQIELSSGAVEAISAGDCNLYWLETRASESASLMVRAIEA